MAVEVFLRVNDEMCPVCGGIDLCINLHRAVRVEDIAGAENFHGDKVTLPHEDYSYEVYCAECEHAAFGDSIQSAFVNFQNVGAQTVIARSFRRLADTYAVPDEHMSSEGC